MVIEYKHINQMDRQDIISCLLASSAIPIVYETVCVENKEYIDGGFIELGNTPIQPLYDNKYKDIYVIALKQDFNIYNIKNRFIGKNGIELKNFYPDCNINVIKPLKDLGGIFKGTLNFSKSAIRENMLEGYKAANIILNNERMYYI